MNSIGNCFLDFSRFSYVNFRYCIGFLRYRFGNVCSRLGNVRFPVGSLRYCFGNFRSRFGNSNTNLLVKVIDDGQDNTGFIDSATNNTNDYTYDANGNMAGDKNKEITSIKYNHLNLPTLITFANANSIQYFYNAAGQKVKKLVVYQN